MSLKPICVPCERFMRMKKGGFYFIEGMPTITQPVRGKGSKDWKPYKVWAGDLWECPTCHTQVINGVGHSPLAEHYQPDFGNVITEFKAYQLFVKDC